MRKSGGTGEARGGMGRSLGSLFGHEGQQTWKRDREICTPEHANL